MPEQVGMGGVVPFHFRCQRSGRCCTGGSGFVWVEAEEVPALAQAAGQTQEAFERLHLRSVTDPRSGAVRLSLREGAHHAGVSQGGDSGGPCSLLEGHNHCSVYEARPKHCREFPFWPSVLEDRAAFESARQTCPGITPMPNPALRERAFAALEALYAELDLEIQGHSPRCEMSGVCCRFEEAGHRLYSTALEADYSAHRKSEAPAPEAPGRCPYHVRGLCTAREGRPIGCRTYFCDPLTEDVLQDVHEVYLARVRAIEREAGYAPNYAPYPELLAARGVGEASGENSSGSMSEFTSGLIRGLMNGEEPQ